MHTIHFAAAADMNANLRTLATDWDSRHSRVQLSDVARHVAAEDDLNKEHTDLGELVEATCWAFENAADYALSEPHSVIFGHMPICWMISE